MKNQKVPVFFFRVIAIILGVALYRQFDFQNLTFAKPALALVYLIVFGFSIYFLIKNAKNQSEK